MGRVLVTPPATEPVTIAEAKAHVRVTSTDEDGLITALVLAAREQAEMFTRRALMLQTWRLTLDAFPLGDAPVWIPLPPLQSVVSVLYFDEGGVQQTLPPARYQVDTSTEPGRIAPAVDDAWPGTEERLNAVTIEFTAGFGTAQEVPQSIKQAMLLLIGHWYEHRETVITGTIATSLPMAAEALLWSQRVLRL